MMKADSSLQQLTSLHTSPPPLHVAAVSCDYFVLADACSLQLWDSCFYTHQDHTTATISCSSKVSVLRLVWLGCVSVVLQVWCVEGCVYVCSAGSVRGWKLEYLQRSTLSAALGKSDSSKMRPKIVASWPVTCEVDLCSCMHAQ